MKLLFSITLIFLSVSNLHSQSDYTDSLWNKGSLDEAINAHRELYILSPEDQNNTYNLACAFALTRQADSTFKYLEIALEDEVNVQTFGNSDFYFMIDDPRWDSLRNVMIDKIESSGVHTYGNRDLAIELWTMKMKDQAFYYHEEIATNKTSKQAIWELKTLLNEENLVRLNEIIDEYGWPKSSDVGGSAASSAFLIVQHADLETQKKYLPVMREAADNGEAAWSSLALLIDRIEMREGRPQIYGSQIRGDGNGKLSVYEIKDPEYVNQRRKQVGLGPIQDYIKNWDLEWTIEQKEK